MRARATVWLGFVALAAVPSCYLGADTVASNTDGGLDGSAVDLDAGRITADVRVDASRSDGSTFIPMLDAGCTSNLACPQSAPVCNGGTCSACKLISDCGRFPSAPACATSGACVTCTVDQKSLCTGDAGLCDSVSNSCVQCLTQNDCPSVGASACSNHSCAPCTTNAECDRFDATKVCHAGTCVACTPASEKTDCRFDKNCDPKLAECPGSACDPKLFTCTNKARSSVATCQTCVSDSECVSFHRCIDMVFGSGAGAKELGGHCLKEFGGDAGTCLPPYARTQPIVRDSLSGVPGGSYCGIDEAVTSCSALDALDKSKFCSGNDATACDAAGAICRTLGTTANSCTYTCTSSFDCPKYAPCGGPADARFCGGT